MMDKFTMLTHHRIVEYVRNLRRGQTTEHEDEELLMLDLVKEYTYSNIPQLATNGAPRLDGQEIVVRNHSPQPNPNESSMQPPS